MQSHDSTGGARLLSGSSCNAAQRKQFGRAAADMNMDRLAGHSPLCCRRLENDFVVAGIGCRCRPDNLAGNWIECRAGRQSGRKQR